MAHSSIFKNRISEKCPHKKKDKLLTSPKEDIRFIKIPHKGIFFFLNFRTVSLLVFEFGLHSNFNSLDLKTIEVNGNSRRLDKCVSDLCFLNGGENVSNHF